MEKIEIAAYLKAGKIASEVVKTSKGFIKNGMPLIEIADRIEGEIVKLGGEPAFPVNLSLNEIAAHYTPSLKDETRAEGLLKIDLGVSVDGFIADTAFSVDLTPEQKFEKMIKLNEKALDSALGAMRVGVKVNEIGKNISEIIRESGFTAIRNLSGHSLGEDDIHAGLTISNYENNNDDELKDIAIAIEPFLTEGVGEVFEGKPSEIYKLQNVASTRDRDARKILEFIIKNYKTRPFCKRWLERKFSKVTFALAQMTKQGILHNFPVLIEKSRKPVSQAEHTVIIADEAIVTTR